MATATMGERAFPIHPADGAFVPEAPGSVAWSVVEPHQRTAVANHGQTLDGLARRGGLTWDELLAVLEDRRYRFVPKRRAWRRCMAIIERGP